MSEHDKKCFNKEHKESPICYCQDCKYYMCKKCQVLHSKLFIEHTEYTIEKNNEEIFTGFCNEKDHLDKLDYYCKNHNKLCCSGCIAKIKSKGKGQHFDCDVCLIEDIKEERNNLLKNNLKNLEELSKNIESAINELKLLFEKINQSKDDLKLKIQKIFTEIRNKINDREDELLLEIDKLYEKTFTNEDIFKEINKLPKKIKLSLDKGQLIEKEWEKENKLRALIHECINIENNLIDIQNKNEIMKKVKENMKTSIKFYPEEETDIKAFLSEILSFGNVYIDNSSNDKGENQISFIEINSMNHNEKAGITLEINGIDFKQYVKYFSEEMKYEENEIVFTLFLEGKKENDIDYMFDIFNKSKIKEAKVINFSMRKDKDKLLLELKLRVEDFNFIKSIYKFDYDLDGFSLILKNKFDLNKFAKMSSEEFYTSMFSNILSIKFKHQIIQKFIKSLEKEIKIEKEELDKKGNLLNNERLKKEKEEYLHKLKIINLVINIGIILKRFRLNLDSYKIFNYLTELLGPPGEKEPQRNLNYFKEIIKFLYGIGLKDIFNYIKLDKLVITSLFMKYKTGFSLRLSSNELQNFINEILPSIDGDKNDNKNQ